MCDVVRRLREEMKNHFNDFLYRNLSKKICYLINVSYLCTVQWNLSNLGTFGTVLIS